MHQRLKELLDRWSDNEISPEEFGELMALLGQNEHKADIEAYLRTDLDLNFDIDFLRFSIRDKKAVKRTALQEVELTPLYIAGDTKVIKAKGQQVIVVALPKCTLAPAKVLALEVGERNGGRHLSLAVRNRHLITAIPLPSP